MDYRKFAADEWQIYDDEHTRTVVIKEDWNEPRLYASKCLFALGEGELAKPVEFRAISQFFDRLSIRLKNAIQSIDSESVLSNENALRELEECIRKFAHFRPSIRDLKKSHFRGVAVDALVKLEKIYASTTTKENWSIFIEDPDSIFYDPEFYNELTERFPELCKLEEFEKIRSQKDWDRLQANFPQILKYCRDITCVNTFTMRKMMYGDDKEPYYQNLLWFAKKLVECYEVCQTCPEYTRVWTDDIMVGIRGLVQRLMAELPAADSGTSDTQ